MDSYCSRADVAAALGAGATTGITERLDMACLLGTQYVDSVVTGVVDTTELTPPYTVDVVYCPPAYRAAAIVAAVRFLKSPDAPFGVMQVGEYGMTIKGAVPEADLILRGHRESFGFAG